MNREISVCVVTPPISHTSETAVGGKMIPGWIAGEFCFLSERFYWLCEDREFADDPIVAQHMFGSNIPFRADAFQELGKFNVVIGGQKGDEDHQEGETKLCARMLERHRQGVWYDLDSTMAHKVFEYRTEFRWLVDGAFWQGSSKQVMESFVDNEGKNGAFLCNLLLRFILDHLRNAILGLSLTEAKKFMMLSIFIAYIRFGYLDSFKDSLL